MDRDKLLQIFNEQISGKNHVKAMRIINNDLISSVNIENEDNLIYIKGNVISESLFNQYETQIEIDAVNKEIVSTYCSCPDYENNEFRSENYCCKHLVATFYESVDDILKNSLFNDDKEEDIFQSKNNVDTLSMLLGDEKYKEEIKIEIYVNRNQWDNKISAEFRIGLSSMNSNELYVLKNLKQFLMALYNNVPINYGKKFTFNMSNNKLSIKDKVLIDFIQMVSSLEESHTYRSKIKKSNIDGKYVHIPDYLVREFFEVVKDHRVYLDEGFLYRCIETEILEKYPPIEFDLRMSKGNYILKLENGPPVPLSSRNNVFFYGSTIYIPDAEYCTRINPYLTVFNGVRSVALPASKEEFILRNLIPQLNLLSDSVAISRPIKNKIVNEKCEFNFYFDEKRKHIILTTKVKYGSFEFNIFEDCREKIIYRDSKRELEILGLLRSLGFERMGNEFRLMWGDDYVFRFFKSEIEKLQNVGGVFYSENFKGIRSINSKNISGNIQKGKYDYLEMKFKLGDIPEDETTAILQAFRDNLKYYKLKSGEYLDLEELELKKFLKLLDVVSPKKINENYIQIPKNKGIYLDEYIEQNNIRYIKGKSELKKIRDKLKNIDTIEFKEPDNLGEKLRDYQKTGYNWFKMLDYLGFGGILGDEMGLGKTFQAIAFLISNPNSKSLIVVPTSLVYNWIHEFEKFAPHMKAAAVNGTKKERKELIDNIDKWDVVITTYNLLKRDITMYREIDFDYCILDEAQYIKNPHSQNAESVKKIRAKTRFALSGTPIENSVMELWSIFDFIMPGYLYDEKRFSVRYYKRFKEEPVVIEDLNRLIKPFVLRRKKKDVIKELPQKIEKTIMVNMDKKQKKVYGTYAKHALALIEKKVEDDEFKSSKIEILAYITKLRQLCLDPSIVMDNYTGNSAKIEALMELLVQSIDEGHKILVFSQFTSVLKNIVGKIAAESIDYSYLDGSVPSRSRMKIVEDFNNGNNPVFLISLKAGGTGLNLTSADVVIHFDPWWNPAVEEQATDRAHRIGQKHVVEVIKLVAKGTIEEKIIQLQREKKKLIDSLIGDGLSGDSGITALSEEEIVNLFK
ncbi:MAG: DEAD/DEAH box helicase [Clostridium tyrobutyricum]|jgi:SNF2 family DNA or RNA helicase|uniref:DEAD/DEAH box helicase n=1 Tax=Clostridium tyrobutyricum TaxID=1519 RepID=UPI0024323F58|nr:DEAD/DEAH box helicase [Clostridium tyrobutyricum]MCH4198824.1 DEAD/DEAH box helicase [Clostridium tyrobutyricum]MCH4259542.1 DEAD/DEAH box helicase [Clostridium tyrobutyricum]MCI1240016.1 DEAD/DEAH box helicase [Clostridium tyrobutyricum]MCI1651216.1 DEAD/DEAH box helicase [Clostridium tyrobutyricum]MCI1938345.1 DEAD/DEAH box helicase [Clostridium tyrobutyricum]